MSREIIEKIRERFKEKVEIFEKSPKRIYVNVDKKDSPNVIQYLFEDLGARFSIASGVDTRAGIEILYHMAFDNENLFVTVRTLAPKPNPEIDSIVLFLPGAEWIEREIHDLLGVNFIGHPNLERLLLSDDWPEGKYPLRKEEES